MNAAKCPIFVRRVLGICVPLLVSIMLGGSAGASSDVYYLEQGEPGDPGKDIWVTSVYSYTPDSFPGGGKDDYELVTGGWGDLYYSLLEFDLSGMPPEATTATLELFCFQTRSGTTTALYLDRITESWDWRIQGTGADMDRLWWADRPATVQWIPNLLPPPTVGEWYSIDITDLYNAWMDGTYPNHGLQLRPGPNAGNNTWSEFYSSNYSDDPTLRPRLVVESETSPPPPPPSEDPNDAPAVLLQETLGLCPVATPALGDDGILYAAGAATCNSFNIGIIAIDPSTGSVLWGPVIPPGCNQHVNGPAFGRRGVSVGENGLLYAVGDWNECRDGRLVAFTTGGVIAWDHGGCPSGGDSSPHPRQVPAIDEATGNVLFGSSNFCAANMDTAGDTWVQGGGYYIGGRGIAIDNAGNSYYGTYRGTTLGRIRSFSPTGVLRWNREVRAEVMGLSDPATLLLYQLESNHSLLAWETATGASKWQVANLTRPVVDVVGNIYASAATTAEVVSLHADGSERWRIDLGTEGVAKVYTDFLDDRGTLYVRGDATLFALNSGDGSISWRFTGGSAALEVGVVLDSSGRLVLSDTAARLFVLDTTLGYAPSVWPRAVHGNHRRTSKAADGQALLGHWPLNEGGGVVTSDMATGLGGLLINDPAWVLGQQLGALEFDGQDDYVEVTDPESHLDLTNALTIALWVNPGPLGGVRELVSKDNAYEFEIRSSNAYSIRLNNLIPGTGNTPVETGVWQHLAITWDGSTVRYYYNGLADGSASFNDNLNLSAASLGFGARPSPPYAGGPAFFFDGRLDDVRLYSQALTAGEIAALFDATLTDISPPVLSAGAPTGVLPPGTTETTLALSTSEDATCRYSTTPGVDFASMSGSFTVTGGSTHSTTVAGLSDEQIVSFFIRCQDTVGNINSEELLIFFAVGTSDVASGRISHWTFDEGSGCDAFDTTGLNDATLGPGCPADAPQWTNGQSNTGLAFAVGHEVRVSSPALLSPLTEVTLSAWIRHPSATGAYRAIIDHRDTGTDGYDLYIAPSSRLFMRVNNATVTGNRIVADDSWHHVVGIYDGAELRLYVDGLLDASASAPMTTIEPSSALYLGRHHETLNYPFLGELDEVQIHDRALSAIEVVEVYYQTQ